MVKRMLIDATHPEETRVVVLDGTRLEEFDVETSTKKQNKSNIYLAKVIRVEPSLQAAFVDYGGGRHGFLAFSEIHPDYYQIPVADRERLLAEVQRHENHDEDDHANEQPRTEHDGTDHHGSDNQPSSFDVPDEPNHDAPHHDEGHHDAPSHDDAQHNEPHPDSIGTALPLSFATPTISSEPIAEEPAPEPEVQPQPAEEASGVRDIPAPEYGGIEEAASQGSFAADLDASAPQEPQAQSDEVSVSEASSSENFGERESQVVEAPAEERPVDVVGGAEASDDDDSDDESEDEDSRRRRRFLASRHYKIQEVIKRRQIMLVQVVKEERGNKGAALTTYLSLAGRYCVLMPNSSRGGGVSRKITNATDRRRLKSIMAELQPPKSAAVILRTAGAERSKPEIKRDYEYLMRTWDQIRENTLQSRAPALIHEEGNIIKRAIRDVYSKDIEDVFVEGEEGYKTAKDFMRMLTPSHSKRVQFYDEKTISLFQRYQVESQLEAINTPSVQLRSGGSIVFGQTEALVAIDVNSGRATRERHIEETALKTNIEAADEIARQLRLRDLAGLVVIDFIDMEENRNNHAVERRLKEALKLDRARIQVGRISHFGLLELSRQRLRPSLIETNFRPCGHCGGTGLIRSIESSSIYALRMIEEEGIRRRSSELTVTVHPDVALYLLNYKREGLAMLEARYGLRIFVLGDVNLIQPNLRIDRVKATRPMAEDTTALTPHALPAPAPEPEPEDEVEVEDEESNVEDAPSTEPRRHGGSSEQGAEGGRGRGRGRRRRRGRGPDGARDQAQGSGQEPVAERSPQPDSEMQSQPSAPSSQFDSSAPAPSEPGQGGEQGRDGGRRRRRGRRGGRNRHREGGEKQNQNFNADGSANQTSDSSVNGDTEQAGATRFAAQSEPSGSESGESQGSGRKRGFFSAIKETALSWTRGDTAAEPEARVEPKPESKPEPRFETPRIEAPRFETPRVETPRVEIPRVEERPYTPPPPPPATVVVQPPPPPPAPVVEQAPSGPPRRGWWSEPKS